jgi:iron complex outermembrane receptor protein
MTSNIRTLLCAAASAAALAEASSAPAQTASDSASERAARPTVLGDVVVTARKRAENLQNVPASIQAVGAAQLERLNVKSLEDLNGTTPGAHLDDAGNLTIRGISSNARNAGFEAGAGVYVDGVYIGRPLSNDQDLVDVGQVEILRGPQGTLFGKNTTAGAVSITTVQPGNSWRGDAEIQYGQRNDLRVAGYVAGPLVPDLVGLKLGAFERTSDGYQHNVYIGATYGNYDERGGRVELRITPGTWDLALRGDYDRDYGTPAGQVPVTGFATAYASGMDNVAYNTPYYLHREGGGYSFTANDALPGGYTFTSISAWRSLRTVLNFDDDFSPLTIASHHWVDKSHQISQELRLASPSEGKFTWLVGGYFFYQDLGANRPVSLTPPFPVTGTLNDIVTVKTYSFAGFANADYHFTDALTLNVGLRYTSEHKTLNFDQIGILELGYPNLLINDQFTDSDVSPTAALSYKFSPQATGYLKYSKGFKSGGWNPDITTTTHIGFNPEDVTNYEAGLRTRLFQDRLSANVTAYYMDYDNLQVSQFLGTFSGYVITNAGKARVKGVEIDLQAQPVSWLNLTAGGAYNDAKYVQFDSGTGVSYAGQQFTFAPVFTAFVSGDVRTPVATNVNLIAHLDYRYQSTEYFDDQRSYYPGIGPAASGPYGLLNGHVGVALRDGLTLEVFGENLTDNRALTNRLTDGLSLGVLTDIYLPPREVGVRAAYRF